jgi:hypothetical protein
MDTQLSLFQIVMLIITVPFIFKLCGITFMSFMVLATTIFFDEDRTFWKIMGAFAAFLFFAALPVGAVYLTKLWLF